MGREKDGTGQIGSCNVNRKGGRDHSPSDEEMRRIRAAVAKLNDGRTRTFSLDGAGHRLSIEFYPTQLGSIRRLIHLKCNLPSATEEAREAIDSLRKASLQIGSGRALSDSQAAWMSQFLLNLYLNASSASRANWDIRTALGLPTGRERPAETGRRDLFLALDVELLRALQ